MCSTTYDQNRVWGMNWFSLMFGHLKCERDIWCTTFNTDKCEIPLKDISCTYNFER
jgi:hypothetical protein